MTKSTALDLTANTGGVVTPEHKRFQTLMAKIDKARARLQAWQEQLPLFAKDYKAKVEPELVLLLDQRFAWAFDIEQSLLTQRLSKTETATLTEELLGCCKRLLDELDARPADERKAQVKALFDRHAEQSFDDAERLQTWAMRERLEEAHGLDFGDEDIATMDELMARTQEQLAQRVEQDRLRREAQGEPPPDADADPAPPRGRSKPKHGASAAQKRAEEEAKEASQTVRDVFRKLAAVLHPDRIELGASDEQRAQRTALMQRANTAYGAGDLLSLLTLQLEIEQVSQVQVASMAASQLRHFNKVLAEQLRELEREIDGRQHALEMSYHLPPLQRLAPTQLAFLLKDEVRSVQNAAAQLERQRRILRTGGPVAKRFLKDLRQAQGFNHHMDEFLSGLF